MRACARAPVRVDLAGGGTDAPPYCIDHGGAVVNFAVQRHVFASAQRLPPGTGIVIYAADLDAGAISQCVSDLTGQPHLEFLKAFVMRMVPENDSLLLVTESDVPPGSGLGGSGALGVAIVAAIDRAYGRARSSEETAALANDIERNDLGYPGGDQDSYGAAFGDINLLQYRPGGGMNRRRLSITRDMQRALEFRSLLIYSGIAHASASIHEDIKRTYAEENSSTLQALQMLHQQADSMAEALEAGDLSEYAATLNESCRQLYRIHESCDSVEHRRYSEALADLILGAKTCGAGGGGFLFVFTKPGRRQECIRRVEGMGGLVWPVTIDFCGVTSWLERSLDIDEIQHVRQVIEARQ